MSYRWWVFVHLVGVFGFLASHGVSMGVAFRLRKERDPERVAALLEVSSRSITPFYVSFLLLLVGGVVATFVGHLWSFGWIWAAIATLVLVSLLMFLIATPYYKRIRFIARAMAEGSEAVTGEQFDAVLRSRRLEIVAAVGVAALGFILYLMLFKPALGLAPAPGPQIPVAGPSVEIRAEETTFSTDRLVAPAGESFVIVLHNDAPVPHNVAIYEDDSAARAFFVGDVVTGPTVIRYEIPGLESGTYFFRCDVHPTTMTGNLVVG